VDSPRILLFSGAITFKIGEMGEGYNQREERTQLTAVFVPRYEVVLDFSGASSAPFSADTSQGELLPSF
jgi:hypothetical protein